MTAIIRVAIDVPIGNLFDYLSDDARPTDIGARVLVSFGRRKLVGLIVQIVEQSEVSAEKLRHCEEILRDIPPLPDDLIELARFCSDYYQTPIGEAMLILLPPRLRRLQPVSRPYRICYAITEAGVMALQSLPSRQRVRRRILEQLMEQPRSRNDLATVAKANPEQIAHCVQANWIVEQDLVVPKQEFRATHALNEEQLDALGKVTDAFANFQSFLLFGITGSGKTEVYLNLIDRVVKQDRQALVLVPEIALTPSLEALFRDRFPGTKICMQHSEMGESQRALAWLEAASGEGRIILGTRLAVFVPIPNLGLIIVDEEQDSSYKQQEGLRYSARDLAVFRARQRNIPILLCSATPSLESLHHAQSGRYRMLRLSRRAHIGAKLPGIRIVDISKAATKEGISEDLLKALKERLERKEQSVLFLNRRGYAPVLACGQCGWVSGCPRCSVNLVLHLKARVLRCHHCGHQAPIPRHCPQCGNLDISPLGRGTQRLESEISERFPGATIVRIDSDHSRGKLAGLIESAHSGQADILVGTQLLAKGHHFERVTLVGILNADSGLYASDYRAPERLFAQLQQVSGRAGRAALPGEVFIQTRFPLHPLYEALRRQDYEAYARELLNDRRVAGFPPFVYEAALRVQASSMDAAMKFLHSALALAPGVPDNLSVYDPAPASISRLAGVERAQLLVQSRSRRELQDFLRTWNSALSRQKAAVRWHFDVDPTEF